MLRLLLLMPPGAFGGRFCGAALGTLLWWTPCRRSSLAPWLLPWPVLAQPGGLVDAGRALIYLGPERLNGGMGTGSGLVAGEKGRGVEWVGMPRQ